MNDFEFTSSTTTPAVYTNSDDECAVDIQDDFDKQLEKEIEQECSFNKYISPSSSLTANTISDDDLLSKSKLEIIQYKNKQITELKNIIINNEHEKDSLIDNYKDTINKLLERIKELETKSIGTRPQTATIAKRIQQSSSNGNNNKAKPVTTKQRCANCGNTFTENEFLAHSLQCLRKTFHCKRCGAIVDETKKKEHLDQYRAPTKILHAIKANDLNLFKLGIEHGFKLNKTLDQKKNTALHIICMFNKIDLLRHVFTYSTNTYSDVVNMENDDGKNALILAVINKGVACVQLLLKKGANVKCKDKTLNTPLHIACQQGNVEMVEELMKYNPELTCKNNLGYTPLKMAQVNYHEDLVLLLLSKYNAKLG